MKNIAILAFVLSLSSTEARTLHPRFAHQSNQAKLYYLMQEPATKWGKDKPHPGYESFHDDFDGDEAFGKYDRKVPDHFSGPGSGDDQFMNSMISKYALELAKPDGTPTGEFVFKYPHAK